MKVNDILENVVSVKDFKNEKKRKNYEKRKKQGEKIRNFMKSQSKIFHDMAVNIKRNEIKPVK